jgi:hypothetical protein
MTDVTCHSLTDATEFINVFVTQQAHASHLTRVKLQGSLAHATRFSSLNSQHLTNRPQCFQI